MLPRIIRPFVSCKFVSYQNSGAVHAKGMVKVTDTAQYVPGPRNTRKLTSFFEILGSVLAMFYAMLIALNIGAEMLGFSLLYFFFCWPQIGVTY